MIITHVNQHSYLHMHTTQQKNPTLLYALCRPPLTLPLSFSFTFLSFSFSFSFSSSSWSCEMDFPSAPSSFYAFGSCFTFLVLVLVQPHIASSALLLGLKNHNYHHHNRRPFLQANQSTCALFMGTWVRDDAYPLYQFSDCPFIDAEFNCQMYGRPDTDYLKYRWKPTNCELPRCLIFFSSFTIASVRLPILMTYGFCACIVGSMDSSFC